MVQFHRAFYDFLMRGFGRASHQRDSSRAVEAFRSFGSFRMFGDRWVTELI